ncbi:MAG TPA: methyltransferase domain-containing protein [Vicinamibacterales bacterium]
MKTVHVALSIAVLLATALPGVPAQSVIVAAQAPQTAKPAAQPKKPQLFPPQDLGLLEPPDRDDWAKPEQIMDAVGIADGATVADLGAGGGWMEIRLARRVGPNGIVYAEDIQSQMIEVINRRMQHEGLSNVRTVMGTKTDPRLPAGLDAALIVNGYGEMDDRLVPEQILTFLKNVAKSLKPQGRLGIADFLPGGGGPGPAAEDRVNPDNVIRAAEQAGFKLQTRENVPPFMFVLVFTKAQPTATR